MTDDQQPPEGKQPRKKRSSGSAGGGANSRSRKPAQPSQDQQQPESAPPEQPIPEGLNLSEVLQQQIAQAIQPVLDEFRQQVARNVEEGAESGTGTEANGKMGHEEAHQVLANQPQETEEQASDSGGPEAPTSQSTAQTGGQQPASPSQESTATASQGSENQQSQAQSSAPAASGSAQDETAPDEHQTHPEQTGTEQPAVQSSSTEQPASQKEGTEEQQPQHSLVPQASDDQVTGQVAETADQAKQQSRPGQLVTGALHLVERQGEQWIQTALVAGLSALLTEKTHQAAQQRAEQALHQLLQRGFASLPENQTTRELRTQTEKTLQAIVRDSIDAVFAETTRQAVEEQGKLAIHDSLHGEFGSALNRAEDAVKAIVDALVAVLRRQWQRVLRLLLKVILAALENSLTSSDDD